MTICVCPLIIYKIMSYMTLILEDEINVNESKSETSWNLRGLGQSKTVLLSIFLRLGAHLSVKDFIGPIRIISNICQGSGPVFAIL